MDFMEISKKRKTVRKFAQRPVKAEKVEKILEASAEREEQRGDRCGHRRHTYDAGGGKHRTQKGCQ